MGVLERFSHRIKDSISFGERLNDRGTEDTESRVRYAFVSSVPLWFILKKFNNIPISDQQGYSVISIVSYYD